MPDFICGKLGRFTARPVPQTAKFANVVLPGASFFEKSGTFTNGERRVQRVNEVIPPLAGTKTDGQIVSAS